MKKVLGTIAILFLAIVPAQAREQYRHGCGTGCAVNYERIGPIKGEKNFLGDGYDIFGAPFLRTQTFQRQFRNTPRQSTKKTYIWAKCIGKTPYALNFEGYTNWRLMNASYTSGIGDAYKAIGNKLCSVNY